MINFSILIPTYNSESTIAKAVTSIITQHSKSYEVLIVDNNSNDRTYSIIQSFISKGHPIKIYSQSDNGIYDAINFGISKASGQYIYIMGSDDFLSNELVLAKLESHKCFAKTDVIYGNVWHEYYNRIYDGKFDYEKLFMRNICHQSIFINKKVFSIIGNYDVELKVLSDYLHNIKWFFSNRISKCYVNFQIANFSKGGISEKSAENDKFNDKKFEYLMFNGIGKLSNSRLLQIYDQLIWKGKLKSSSKLHLYVYVQIMRVILKSIPMKS